MSENETFRTAYFKEVKRGNELADKHIGTLMLLVYEGCISDSRARELIGMSLEEWRSECGRVIGSPADEPASALPASVTANPREALS